MNFLSKLNLPLGRWFNVPVFLHWSWVLIFLYLLFFHGPMLAVTYAGVFLIVLLHEFGHCIAAQKYGIVAQQIMLYPFGGAASMAVPVQPKKELVVALAGPFVNVLLFPLLFLLSPLHLVLLQLFYINIVVFVFNMIPAFPMDGGRVLRSLLSMLWGDHVKATVVAGRIGQGICVFFGIVGVMYGHFMLAVIGLFIFMAAEQEIQMVRFNRKVRGLYRSVTGESPQVSEYDVRASSSMLEDLQRRMSRLDRDDDD